MIQDGQAEEGVVRRYLMAESKINSTLKVGICMKQIDGERNYVAPPLKTAAVFGGIAGIMAGEQGDKDKLRLFPSLLPLLSSPDPTSNVWIWVLVWFMDYKTNITKWRHRHPHPHQIPRRRRTPRHVPSRPRRLLGRANQRAISRSMHRRYFQRGRRLERYLYPSQRLPDLFPSSRNSPYINTYT